MQRIQVLGEQVVFSSGKDLIFYEWVFSFLSEEFLRGRQGEIRKTISMPSTVISTDTNQGRVAAIGNDKSLFVYDVNGDCLLSTYVVYVRMRLSV